MIVTLNGFVINDNVSGAFLNTQLDGLDLPSIRTSSGNYAGRAGGYVGGQFYGMRSIGIQGKVFGSSVAGLAATRKALQTALDAQSVTMQLITNDGASYILYAYLTDFEMPITQALFSAPYQIELLAPDPIIYDNATGTALTTSISRITSGGYTYPVVYPVIYAAASAPTTVTNSGTTGVYPIIMLTGSATNPVITNRTTNMLMSLNLTTGSSDVIVIDMRQRTITLNGGSIFGLQGAGSSFWSLPVGPNSIALTTSGGSDTVTGAVSWRSGVMGI